MTTLDENQKNALCSAIRTSRYSRKVVTLLRDMSDNLYKTDSDVLMTSMEHSMDEDLLNVFTGILRDADASNPMEAEQKLRNVIEFIRDLDEVSFVIPIHPNKEFVKRMFGGFYSESAYGKRCIDDLQGILFRVFIRKSVG